MLNYCPQCGNKLKPDSSLCEICGVDLKLRQKTAKSRAYPNNEDSQELKFQREEAIYADLLKRILAFFLDTIIIGIAGSGLSWLLFLPWVPQFNIFNPLGSWWIIIPFDWLVGFLYYWLLEAKNRGQTLGKMALNIRTVDEKTLKPSTTRNYAINNLLKGSPFLIIDLIFGFLKNSEDQKKRIRVMQNFSKTVVVIN